MVVPEDNQNQPLDIIGQLQLAVKNNPTDYILWTKLLDQVIIKDLEDQVRATFDEYLSIFKFDVCDNFFDYFLIVCLVVWSFLSSFIQLIMSLSDYLII